MLRLSYIINLQKKHGEKVKAISNTDTLCAGARAESTCFFAPQACMRRASIMIIMMMMITIMIIIIIIILLLIILIIIIILKLSSS